MARLAGNLADYNLAKIVIIDVTDDYRLMQPPLPSEFYPVLKEIWMPCHQLSKKLPGETLVQGFLYDWHEMPDTTHANWYVGVVNVELTGAS